MDQVDCVVIGAGVVGLAVARGLALQGREVLILEEIDAYGTVTSARNSEVIHAGLYYPLGSLKGRLCIEGRDLLYAYLRERDLPFKQCGKLIVATTEAQVAELAAIKAKAEAAGAGSLGWLSGAEAMAQEPALSCVAALSSPLTGIIDSHSYMTSLLGDAEAAGAALALQTEVTALRPTAQGIVVETADGYSLCAKLVVNCAGLNAPALAAKTEGLPPHAVPQARYAKGTWFGVPGRAVFSQLIYPVPEPGGLGIHLTIDLGGGMRFGPDVEWVDGPDYALSQARAPRFAEAIRRYWPEVPEASLSPISSGVRPKLHGPDDPAADFRIDGPQDHGVAGLINLFGIESPGLTSSLAIAAHVVAMTAE